MNDLTILQGDCRELLAQLPDASVHCVISSPPYWGLRDYGTAAWVGGDAACAHQPAPSRGQSSWAHSRNGTAKRPCRDVCAACGAERHDQQIGLEPTPLHYIATMVQVFEEVRRVLRDDGTLWLNLGDCYANDKKWGGSSSGKHVRELHGDTGIGRQRHQTGLRSKNLVGLPWRVAFALQDAGWILRTDIIWHKPTAMPESVRDRPTRDHEYIFLFSKQERYYYDAEGVKEPTTGGARPRGQGSTPKSSAVDHYQVKANASFHQRVSGLVKFRNKRTVWSVASQPYRGAHYATFPEKLIEPCILAGSAPRCCEVCGAPWARQVERWRTVDGERAAAPKLRTTSKTAPSSAHGIGHNRTESHTQTTGWAPTCTCQQEGTGRAVVLDPFGGSGTTGQVALRHGRNAILIELNPAYVKQAERRAGTAQRAMEGV